MTNLSLKVWYLPHSPDLTTLDFHLCQYLKDIVYHTKPATLEELLEEITASCAAIPEHKLDGICNSYVHQIQHCPHVNREHSEHKSQLDMSQNFLYTPKF
jgi:hypothetical protein